MAVLSLSNVSKHFSGYDILKNISFSIERDFKVGLIGKNGSGKTTLFKLVKGELLSDSGEIFVPKKIRISFLQQEAKFSENQTIVDFVLSGAKEYTFYKKQLAQIEKKVSQNHSEQNMKALSEIQTKFEVIGGYDFEQRMKSILYSLKFPESVWYQDLSSFSGGEKTRLQLAKTLVQPFDLLLLDEPTNHLDIGMIYWLENYLSSLTKPYILISHDRYFLDKTVNRIFEIKKKNLQIYKGNFMSYQTESKRLDELAEKQFDQQQKKIKKEEEFIRKNMAGQKVNQAKSRQKQLEKMDIIEKPTSRRKVNLNFAIKKRSGERVYQFKNASFGFDEPLFEDFNEMIKFQDKIAILGKNGCGKSTLLKIINDEYKLNRGEIIHGSSISLGYYDQFHIELDEDLTVKETLLQLRPNMTDGEVYSYLAKYEFYEKDWDKKVQFISGGERSRLYLSKLIFQKPNVLILDEPTNHLDILMIDSLESALKNYEGTIIFVSHDRLFIENVANRLFLFDNKKITEVFRSLKQIFDENLRHDTKEKKVRKQSINKKNSKKTNPFLITKLENKIEVLEDDISKIKNEIDQLELQFSNPKNLANPQFMKELNGNIKLKKNNLKKIIGELDNAEIDYLEMIEE